MRRISIQQFEANVANVRRQEREKAAADLNNAIAKAQLQFQRELKKLSDTCFKKEQEKQQLINTLAISDKRVHQFETQVLKEQRVSASQKRRAEELEIDILRARKELESKKEQEKKQSLLVERLKSNLVDNQQQFVVSHMRVGQLETQLLKEQRVSASRKRTAEELEIRIQRVRKELETDKEDTQEKLAISDNRVRQLETQVLKEQQKSASRTEELEIEIQRAREELESEKASREKEISELEHVINDATRDADFERQRLDNARERIMHMETRLRAFGLTKEKIESLFAKQQETLKAMHKALEDKESCYQNASLTLIVDPNQTTGNNDQRVEPCSDTTVTKA